MENKTKERNSNIELLRIILMFFIILHHLIYHNYLFLVDGANQKIAIVLASGAKIAVNCYIILLGYFGLKSKFDIKKIISLLLEILFYEFIFYMLFNLSNINLQEFIKNISQYWFINGYIIIYLLSPLLKKYVSKAPTIIQIVMFITLLIYCLANPREQYTYIIWFIELFFTGIYIRKLSKEKFSNWIMILIFIYTFFLIIKTNTSFEYINILALICAILLILIFNNIEIKNNKVINSMARYITGIYLIHDNIYIRKYVIQDILFIKEMYVTNSFTIYTIIVAILIYAISIAIDVIRDWIFGKIVFKNNKLNKLYEKINKKVEKANDL